MWTMDDHPSTTILNPHFTFHATPTVERPFGHYSVDFQRQERLIAEVMKDLHEELSVSTDEE